MVSTRGIKVDFAHGECVLCFEPDLSKARVLYDAKVTKVCIWNLCFSKIDFFKFCKFLLIYEHPIAFQGLHLTGPQT